MGTDKVRRRERQQERHGERGMETFWVEEVVPREKQMVTGKEKVMENGRD